MPASTHHESPADLLAAAKDAGFRLTRAQLVRWHVVGVLPRPQQRSLGRGRGTETRYPSGTTDQLLKACVLRRERRNFDAIRWGLWWEGFETWPPRSVQERLSRAAEVDWPALTGELAVLVPGINGLTLEETVYGASEGDIQDARREVRNLVELLELRNSDETMRTTADRVKVRVSGVARLAVHVPEHMLRVLVLWLALRRFEPASRWYEQTLPTLRVLLAPFRTSTA